MTDGERMVELIEQAERVSWAMAIVAGDLEYLVRQAEALTGAIESCATPGAALDSAR